MDYESLRIILGFCFLVPIVILDIRQRTVPLVYFLIFACITGVLWFLDPIPLWQFIPIPLYLLIWRVGIFGGGDVFALAILTVMIGTNTITGTEPIPFTLFLNSLLLSISIVGLNMLRNLTYYKQNGFLFSDLPGLTTKNKVIACCLGSRSKNPKNAFLMEKTMGGQKTLDFKMRHAEHEQFTDKKDVWVFATIPFLVFILGGLLIQLFYGDLIFHS